MGKGFGFPHSAVFIVMRRRKSRPRPGSPNGFGQCSPRTPDPIRYPNPRCKRFLRACPCVSIGCCVRHVRVPHTALRDPIFQDATRAMYEKDGAKLSWSSRVGKD